MDHRHKAIKVALCLWSIRLRVYSSSQCSVVAVAEKLVNCPREQAGPTSLVDKTSAAYQSCDRRRPQSHPHRFRSHLMACLGWLGPASWPVALVTAGVIVDRIAVSRNKAS